MANPLHESVSKQPAGGKESQTCVQAATRVLVVEDERTYCEVIERSLVRDGFQVETAFSGEEAVAKGLRMRPDVLVTDFGLGVGLDGLCVCEALTSADPTLATILISGRPKQEVLAWMGDRGIHVLQILSKPFPLKDLGDAIRRAMLRRG